MKKKLSFSGIIGIMLVFGVVLMGCSNPTNGENPTTYTITYDGNSADGGTPPASQTAAQALLSRVKVICLKSAIHLPAGIPSPTQLERHTRQALH
jgi:hypothetical protein